MSLLTRTPSRVLSRKGAGVFVVALLLTLPAAGASASLEPSSDPRFVFHGFTAELASHGLTAAFPSKAVAALQAVRFASEPELGSASAMYEIDANTIVLATRLFDPGTGTLVPIRAMGFADAGTILHELWHTLFWRVWRHASPEYREFSQGLDALYAGYPASRREEIQEEGYGFYVQESSRAYLMARDTFERSSSEVRRRLRSNPNYVNLYEGTFTAPYQGYYRAGGQVVFSRIPIRPGDKALILKSLFEGKVTGRLDQDCPVELFP
jgi:hypothetical protein